MEALYLPWPRMVRRKEAFWRSHVEGPYFHSSVSSEPEPFSADFAARSFCKIPVCLLFGYKKNWGAEEHFTVGSRSLMGGGFRSHQMCPEGTQSQCLLSCLLK